MGARPFFVFVFLMVALSGIAGCASKFPEKVTLAPDAANVEVVHEAPNREVYEPAGEVSAQIIGHDNAASLREALNMVRNQAAAKGATFVALSEGSSRAAWDLSGRTIVTLVGTAYRPK